MMSSEPIRYNYQMCDRRGNDRLVRKIRIERKVWNHAVTLDWRYKRLYGERVSWVALQNHLRKLRREVKRFEYWQELYSSSSFYFIPQRINQAYTKQKRRPRRKKYNAYTSISVATNDYKLLDRNARGKHWIQKIRIFGKPYEFFMNRPLPEKTGQLDIRMTNDGKLYLSFVCTPEDMGQRYSTNDRAIGIDFGQVTFITTSEGERIDMPQYLKESLDKLEVISRRISQKERGSKAYKRAVADKTRLMRKIKNQRADWRWKMIDKLLQNYDFIAVEDLDMRELIQAGKKIGGQRAKGARKWADLAVGDFRRDLEYKARVAGKRVEPVKPEYTSRRCSRCDEIGPEVPLDAPERLFVCGNCGLQMDRDHNAAINILHRAKRSDNMLLR